ncbi:MAG: hypothetical protein QGG67_19035 [Gammaproteobacteria bacterium]|mgnify:CR=1 FL=1|jgi:hypothetical protein|nr:hypothetical protein [Gammaproteobacteria bacterium]|tara:strand:+ start:607 stop:1257 length:651 start_codon:yes stop_codon:yes gene_type:complete
MIQRAVAILLPVLIAGCVSSRIEQSREGVTGIAGGEGMVILGRASYNDHQTEESFTDCISDILVKGATPIRLIPDQEFKDNLFPWFEPRTAPTSAGELSRLFAQPGVQDRIDEANVRYLTWIDGDTVTVDKGGSMSCTISTFGGGCFGMSYWEQDASYEASIWDLDNLTTAGQISADANGTSYLAGLIVPIPILARPGNAACKGLAKQLRAFVVGE